MRLVSLKADLISIDVRSKMSIQFFFGRINWGSNTLV